MFLFKHCSSIALSKFKFFGPVYSSFCHQPPKNKMNVTSGRPQPGGWGLGLGLGLGTGLPLGSPGAGAAGLSGQAWLAPRGAGPMPRAIHLYISKGLDAPNNY